jgi:hypothetical protein
VHGFKAQSLKDQHVKRALDHVGVCVVHRFSEEKNFLFNVAVVILIVKM